MGNLQGFNANTVAPSDDFAPLADGKYEAMIVESSFAPTKAGDGERLTCVFEIVGEKYHGRKLYHHMNIINPNQTAVAIAQRQLADICLAVGVPTPEDSSELHNVPLLITVGFERNKSTNELVNKIKKFEALPKSRFSAPREQVPAASTRVVNPDAEDVDTPW